MSKWSDGYQAGQRVVDKRKTSIMWIVCTSMCLTTIVEELLRQRYVLAAIAPVFFLVVVPWLWKTWPAQK